MKIILALLTSGVCLFSCYMNTGSEDPLNKITSTKTGAINFKRQVEPIFQKKCSPCHFPGGKLYEKLPFDKSETIVNHKAGIFKRIKDSAELDLVRKYTEQERSN